MEQEKSWGPRFLNRLPGIIATSITTLIATFWIFWGTGEMYHEGWWGAWYNPLFYLIPGTVFLALALIALKWPRLGGWLTLVIGGAFTLFFLNPEIVDGRLTINWPIFIVSSPLILTGILFLVERHNRQKRQSEKKPSQRWWRRNLAYILVLAPPLLTFIIMSANSLPIVLTRVDDGDRSARLIEGNGVSLVWAPEGPGWNWKQPWGGYPSWHDIALYGKQPVGMEDKPGYGRQDGDAWVFASAEDMQTYSLCRYLSEDGLTLMDEPQDIWRMPTNDELVRSLGRHGENAGCTWDGESQKATCDVRPNKESPLWASDKSPIYYWSVDEYNERYAHYVSYNGFVNWTLKSGGNPRHSYRCVKEP
ncbi:MAG: hypothetical protein AB8I69_13545 [Anaerolineae bacterium]|jgi:hypothetical protein